MLLRFDTASATPLCRKASGGDFYFAPLKEWNANTILIFVALRSGTTLPSLWAAIAVFATPGLDLVYPLKARGRHNSH
jgi:hypothetical protein